MLICTDSVTDVESMAGTYVCKIFNISKLWLGQFNGYENKHPNVHNMKVNLKNGLLAFRKLYNFK